MKRVIAGVVFLILAGLLFLIFFSPQKSDMKNVGKSIEQNSSFEVYKIIFKGDDGKEIYALLFAPHQKKFDLVIVLPGAGGTKESRRTYAEIIGMMGYGSLILDQRGIGETNGPMNSLQEDFQVFLSGGDPHQFLMARDVVSAVDVLKKIKQVRDIAVLGESMGGRNALIAAGLDPRIKAAIIISAAGYSGSTGNVEGDKFLAYINPNSYIGKVSPRRVLMLHAINDTVIPIADARYTFSLAQEPKKFVEFSEPACSHGYCEPMRSHIQEELALAFQ